MTAKPTLDAFVEAIRIGRTREVQMIGAGLSNRSWHEVETAYNQLRDRIDRALIEHDRSQSLRASLSGGSAAAFAVGAEVHARTDVTPELMRVVAASIDKPWTDVASDPSSPQSERLIEALELLRETEASFTAEMDAFGQDEPAPGTLLARIRAVIARTCIAEARGEK